MRKVLETILKYNFLFLCSLFYLQAQPEADTARVLIHSITSLKSRNEQIQICAAPSGGFYAVWKSSRGDKETFSLYGQRVSAEGKPLWAMDGLLLTHSQHPQNHPQIITDNEGNLILVWEEGESPNLDLYAQKFDTLGKSLWRKPILLTPKDGDQTRPKILHNHKNQFFVFWEENQKGFSGKDIYAQSFNEHGKILWDPEGVPIVKEVNLQQNFQITQDPGHDIIILWEDFRSGKVWELYAQKINSQGQKLWDSTGLNVLNNLWFNQRNFTLTGDGYGGFICAFEASGLTTAQVDLHIVRVNTIGVKVFEKVISNAYGSQLNPILIKKAGSAYVFWEDYRAQDANLYGQKISLYTGEKEWDTTGVPIATYDAHQTRMQVALIDFPEKLITLWIDERYGSSLFAQALNANAQPLFNNDGLLLTDTQYPVREFQILLNQDQSLWIAYINESAEGILPKFQKIEPNGALKFDLQGAPLHAYQSSITARLDELKIAKGLHQDLYFVWKDYRNGDLNPDIYLMRTDLLGNPLWQEGGIPICTAEGEQNRPLIVPTPFGAIIAWVDRRKKNDENLYFQAIDTNGYIFHLANGMPLCTAPRSQNDLKIVPFQNQYLCIWTDARNLLTTGFDLYYQLLDSLAQPLLSPNGLPFQNTQAYENTPQLVASQNHLYCIWMDDRTMFYNIYCQKLGPYAKPLWRTGGIPIQKANYHQRNHLIALPNDQNPIILWSDERAGNLYEKLFIQKLSPQGQWMWKTGTNLEISKAISRQIAPKILTDPAEGLIVAWLDNRNQLASNYNLYANRLSAHSGATLWNPQGIKIGENLLEDYPFELTATENTILFTWQQITPSGYEQIYWNAIDLLTAKPLFPAPRAVNPIKKHQAHPNLIITQPQQALFAWLEKNIYIIEDQILVKPITLSPLNH